jgi:hypothetical protein
MTPDKRHSVIALLMIWLVTAATRCPAPAPSGNLPGGTTGQDRGLPNAFLQTQQAGFNTVRLFLQWNLIEQTAYCDATRSCNVDSLSSASELDLDPTHSGYAAAAAGMFTCRYVDEDDQTWPPVSPCDPYAPCHCTNPATQGSAVCGAHTLPACGLSADERIQRINASTPSYLATILTIDSTPDWAGDTWASRCDGDSHAKDSRPLKALCPLGQPCSKSWNDFVYAVADRYAAGAFAFELWNEPNLCKYWSGSADDYKGEILPGAQMVKATGALPGCVYATAYYNPSNCSASSCELSAWLDAAQPYDFVSVHWYGNPDDIVNTHLPGLNSWCNGSSEGSKCSRFGFDYPASTACANNGGYVVTEFGFPHTDNGNCSSDAQSDPGAADVRVMNACDNHIWCWGEAQYNLTDRRPPGSCEMGLFDTSGTPKKRMCEIGQDYFGVTPPYTCNGTP